MTLTLTIANVERLENGESPKLVLDKHGAIIGRSPNADWSLPDPKKHISYTHCEISYRGGEYILSDRSTNGTFVNGASERLSAPHTLATGDEITVGHYRVLVRIAGQEAKPGAPAEKPADDWGGANSLDWGSAPVVETPPADQGWTKSTGGWGEAPVNTPPPAPQTAPYQDFTPLAHELWGAPQARPAPPPVREAPAGPAVAGYGALAVNFAPPKVQQQDDVWSRFNEANEVNWDAMGGGAAAPAPAPAATAFDADPFGASAAASPAGADQAWNEFLRAAGLSAEQLKLPPKQAAAAAGAILRRLVAGMVTMLDARARARAEIGATATVIELNGNNPLKFLRHPDAALSRLINPAERGFMEGDAAVEASFRDVQAHQLATVAAMQNALRATLARFSPDAIRQRAESRGLLAKILPAARDAALWQAYQREFEGVVQGSDEAFMDVFAKAFRDAYSRVLNKQ